MASGNFRTGMISLDLFCSCEAQIGTYRSPLQSSRTRTPSPSLKPEWTGIVCTTEQPRKQYPPVFLLRYPLRQLRKGSWKLDSDVVVRPVLYAVPESHIDVVNLHFPPSVEGKLTTRPDTTQTEAIAVPCCLGHCHPGIVQASSGFNHFLYQFIGGAASPRLDVRCSLIMAPGILFEVLSLHGAIEHAHIRLGVPSQVRQNVAYGPIRQETRRPSELSVEPPERDLQASMRGSAARHGALEVRIPADG